MIKPKTKKVLLLFANSSVRDGKADPTRLQELLQEASQELGMEYEIYVSYARSLSFFVSNERMKIRDHRNHMNLEQYDFVYFRKAGSAMQQMNACALYLQSHGVPFYDTEILRATSRNKLSQMFKLHTRELPIVPTLFCRNRRRLLRLVTKDYADTFVFPIIAKATGGTRGDANYLVKTHEELKQILASEKRHFMIQQFIPNDGDYRFFVAAGHTYGIIKRTADGTSHLNNTSQGADAELVPLEQVSSQVKHYAEYASVIFGRDCSGADIMFDKRDGAPYILEINRAPQIDHATFEQEKAQWLLRAINNSVTSNQPGVAVPAKNTIGRLERLSINDHTTRIIAKVDTGADSSSVHAENIQLDEGVLSCEIAGETYTFNDYFIRRVRSSNGHIEERYLVLLMVVIGEQKYQIKVTLADRSSMKHDMLIGRRFLRANNFVVDVSRRFIASSRKGGSV